MAILLATLTFLVVASLLLIPWMIGSRGKQQETIRKRLESVDKAMSRANSSPELQLLRNELLSNVPALNRLMVRWPWAVRLQDFTAQAGSSIKPGALLLASACLGLLGYLLVRHWVVNPLLSLVGVVAAAIPFLYVAIKRSMRLRDFERNFPDALDLLARAVRAGHAFTTGLEMIAKELPEPVAGEFRITFEEQNLGLPLKDALLNLSERVPIIDVRFFVTALLIQKESGGNLAEILDNLAYVIRDRFRIYGEVRVKTAHGRLTAGILVALPPIMALVMASLNPRYMEPLFRDSWGPYMLIIGGTMQVIGSFLLWKIIRIEV
jgi:tight adherence protein B